MSALMRTVVVALVSLSWGTATISFGDVVGRQTSMSPVIDRTAEARDVQNPLPLSFEPNRGQADPAVKFLARAPGYTLTLGARSVGFDGIGGVSGPLGLGNGKARVIRSAGRSLRMRFVGSSPRPRLTGTKALPGQVNYLIGSDPRGWRTAIPTYGMVRYEQLYPGIDAVFHGSDGRLEYDFILGPGADPASITLAFPDADRLEVDSSGDLILQAAQTQLRQPDPLIFQRVDGVRHEISGGYVLTDGHRVKFRVGSYDASRPLIIDPVVLYSTFLGGEGMDAGLGVAADGAGNAYVTGFTSSVGYPTTAGAFRTANGGGIDAFITKLNPSGSTPVYSTYVGGSGDEWGSGITVDASGNAYVSGRTQSTNFPTTPGAFDPTFNGGVDAFVLKLNAAGSAPLYSTYLGGAGFEHDRDNILIVRAAAIAVDGSGNAYVTGQTTSADFPTANALDPTHGGGSCPGANLVCSDVYLTKLNATGSTLVYSTFLGGGDEDAGRSIFVDTAGSAYLTGTAFSGFPITPGAYRPFSQGFEGFVSKVNAAGSSLVFSTFLGGELTDQPAGVAADAAGNAYVTGSTTSFQFPTTPGAFQTSKIGNEADAFVTKLNATGSALVYSTYIGERETDEGVGIAVDGNGNAHIGGHSQWGAPVLPCPTANYDIFAVSLNATGSALTSSTCLGGTRDEFAGGMALDVAGNVYVTGRTASSGGFSTSAFPTTSGAFQPTFAGGATDAFVFKVGESGGTTPPSISINDVSVTEGNAGSTTTANFTVSLSSASASTVTVDYATADGGGPKGGSGAMASSDYLATSGTLTFAPGDASESIPVTVNGDTTDEPDEAFNMVLSSPTNATIGDGTGTGTILDDDGGGGCTKNCPPGGVSLSISDASVSEPDTGTAVATFFVSLSSSSSGTVTVNYVTANGPKNGAIAPGDYFAASGTLTFAPGDTSESISVTVNGDTATEPDETFTVSLSGASGASLADPTGIGTILNDD
jgi:hypothetical protein